MEAKQAELQASFEDEGGRPGLHDALPAPASQATVDERASVIQTREVLSHTRANGGGGGDAEGAAASDDRMRALAARAKMSQIARAQASEIALLRKELDRLRQKAFPAFPA